MITIEDRWAMALPYIRGAKEIAERTQVPFARECWKYLLDYGMVVYAEETEGERCAMRIVGPIQQGASNVLTPPVLVYPLVQEDAQVGDNISRACAGTGVAGYFSDSNMIVFRTWVAPETDFNRGSDFLHEAGHAICTRKENRIGTIRGDLQAKAREEVEMYSLNAALWLEYGGKRYRQLLESAVRDLRDGLRGQPKFLHLEAPQMWANELQAIFGTVSVKAMEHRLGHLAIFAYMEYYRQYHSAIAHDLNVRLMIETGCAHSE